VFYLESIIGTLTELTNLNDEDRESLWTNTTGFASSLLRKKDKVFLLLKASHLYFTPYYVARYHPEKRGQSFGHFAEGSEVRQKWDQARS
jgi:hypothetical protein